MSTKHHWRQADGASCGRPAEAYATAFFFDDRGPYFTDESGERVKECRGCLRLAIAAGIAKFQTVIKGDTSDEVDTGAFLHPGEAGTSTEQHISRDTSHRLRHPITQIESISHWFGIARPV